MAKMKILVAVLNWGLGHATRSIPVIRALEKEGFEPVLASDGEALLLLREEFPALHWLNLPSYRISYPKKGGLMKLHFFLKSPLILRSIIAEHRLIRDYIAGKNAVGGIISDNRFGAFAKGIPSVYITHQLKVFSGNSTFWSSKFHRFFINKFSECWIPDVEGAGNLSGEMGQGIKMNQPVRYLGPLSRFNKVKVEKKYDLLVLLSGPEPQRSLLEKKLLEELKGFKGKILFVRGKLQGASPIGEIEGIKIQDYLTGRSLEDALNASALVLARSGYSTIMDLSVLEKKAFFIPTPGQFEQEYLAARLQESNIAPCCSQNTFSLKELEKISTYSGFPASSCRISLSGVFTLFKGK